MQISLADYSAYLHELRVSCTLMSYRRGFTLPDSLPCYFRSLFFFLLLNLVAPNVQSPSLNASNLLISEPILGNWFAESSTMILPVVCQIWVSAPRQIKSLWPYNKNDSPLSVSFPQMRHRLEATHTQMGMKQVAVGMYKSVRKLGGRETFLAEL